MNYVNEFYERDKRVTLDIRIWNTEVGHRVNAMKVTLKTVCVIQIYCKRAKMVMCEGEICLQINVIA